MPNFFSSLSCLNFKRFDIASPLKLPLPHPLHLPHLLPRERYQIRMNIHENIVKYTFIYISKNNTLYMLISHEIVVA